MTFTYLHLHINQHIADLSVGTDGNTALKLSSQFYTLWNYVLQMRDNTLNIWCNITELVSHNV